MQKWRNNIFSVLIVSLLGVILLVTSSAYAGCPNGITSLWTLDEDSGNSFEDAINGINGSGALSPSPTAGKANGAQLFNGTDTGINVPADNSFNWAYNASFSIEYWIKRKDDKFSDNEVAVGRDDGVTSDMHWWTGLWSDGKAAFILRSTNGKGSDIRASGEPLEGNDDLADGAWHHVVVVRDSATNENRLYVDGVLNDSTIITYDIGEGFESATSNLNLGWLNIGNDYHYNGRLDEVALYDRALIADEILQHFNDGVSYCDDPPDKDDNNDGGGGGGCFVESLNQ